MEELLEGLLEFAAQAGVLTANIEELVASLTSLADTADTVRMSFKNTWATIETGARLEGLSSSTGESVAKLYEFERGLDAVGRKARYLPTIFADMQRALSVANESDRLDSAFATLHLNPDQLRREDTGEALLQVASAMGKLDKNDATWAGDQIFGKFQTGTILAIARNPDLFRHEMNESSQTGALLEKYSKVYEDLRANRSDINNEVLGRQVAFAGIIAPLLPGILAAISDHTKNMAPFSTTSKESKNIVPGLDHYKPEFTSLEKMGFIMSGTKVQNPMEQRKVDLLQQIAQNTSPGRTPFNFQMPPLGQTYISTFGSNIHNEL